MQASRKARTLFISIAVLALPRPSWATTLTVTSVAIALSKDLLHPAFGKSIDKRDPNHAAMWIEPGRESAEQFALFSFRPEPRNAPSPSGVAK